MIYVTTDERASKVCAPCATCLGLTLKNLISILVTNKSVKHARIRSVALFANNWAREQLWLFWLAPILGAAFAGVVYKAVLSKK